MARLNASSFSLRTSSKDFALKCIAYFFYNTIYVFSICTAGRRKSNFIHCYAANKQSTYLYSLSASFISSTVRFVQIVQVQTTPGVIHGMCTQSHSSSSESLYVRENHPLQCRVYTDVSFLPILYGLDGTLMMPVPLDPLHPIFASYVRSISVARDVDLTQVSM
eukprot:sb/3472609/